MYRNHLPLTSLCSEGGPARVAEELSPAIKALFKALMSQTIPSLKKGFPPGEPPFIWNLLLPKKGRSMKVSSRKSQPAQDSQKGA